MRLLRLLCLVLLFWAIGASCHYLTGGFRYAELLTQIPNRAEWEIPPVDEQEIVHLLSQPFTFLGSGDQCYAFLGEDGMTVLKLFRHDTPFSSFLRKKPRYLDPLFHSCLLAYTQLKEETGLIYLHLNKTENRFPTVIFTDKIGIQHSIALDSTEFLLQKKEELFFPLLEQELAHHHIDSAKQMISSLFSCLAACSAKGIADRDTAIRRNLGYDGTRTIFIDVGGFLPNPSLKEKAQASEELRRKTHRLRRWLIKHYPPLLPYFDEQLEK